MEEDDIHLSGDAAELEEEGASVPEGDAEITRGDRQARADRIEYHSAQNSVRLYGDISYREKDLFLRSDNGHVEFDSETGALNKVEYIFKSSRFRGNADMLALYSKTKTRLNEVTNRLAALVPKPKVNLTRFHGVFAPNNKHRALITPGGAPPQTGLFG